MKRSVWIAMVLAACAGGDGGESPDRVDTILSLTGDAANGGALYDATCASCHMADGQGMGDVYPAVAGLSAAEIAVTVLDGVPDTAMLAYGDQLSDQDIADLIAHIQSL